MPKATLSLFLLALAALLAGCANFAPVSSGTPAQQVQAKLGTPETVRKNPDGSEVWEYPGGPFGRQTYMVTLGSDRAVREIHQVLSDEYFARVPPRDALPGRGGGLLLSTSTICPSRTPSLSGMRTAFLSWSTRQQHGWSACMKIADAGSV